MSSTTNYSTAHVRRNRAARINVNGRMVHPNPKHGHGHLDSYVRFCCRCDFCCKVHSVYKYTHLEKKRLLDTYARNISSGAAYVSARHKFDVHSGYFKIKFFSVCNCDHNTTICATEACVAKWKKEFFLLFERTIGGRKLAAALPQA